MLPKKVKKRAFLLAIFLSVSVISIFLILNALNKNILYFNSPSDIKLNQNINFEKKNESWRYGKKKYVKNL